MHSIAEIPGLIAEDNDIMLHTLQELSGMVAGGL